MQDYISAKLVELRGEKTQKEVSEALGITNMSLSHYENGRRRPRVDMLYKIAKYYGVDMNIFFDNE